MRVKHPLGSLQASGSLGRYLSFSSTPAGCLVRLRRAPRQTRTPAQRSHRALWKYLPLLWHQLPPADQLAWAIFTPKHAPTPYHAFIKSNVARWRSRLAPIPNPQIPVDPAYASGGGLSLDVAYRRIDGRVFVAAPGDRATIFFHRAASPGLTPSATNLIRAIPIAAAGYHTFSDFPLAPGTYYYRHIYGYADGSWSVAGTERSAAIT